VSVRPIKFLPNGDVDIVFDELGHSGTIPAAEVVWMTAIDGGETHKFIALTCPDGCGHTSTWPVGGGADAPTGQQLFVQKTQREGCVCGQVVQGDPAALSESHVRLQVNRMDGLGRWQLG
jgi:hypothetical protein